MKKYLLIILVFTLALSSCSDYLDVNTDPNNPTEVTPNLILPVGQVNTAGVMYWDRNMNTLGNMFMQNWSQSQGFSWYDDEFRYKVTSTFYQRIWNTTYRSVLKHYQLLDVNDPTYSNYAAIAKIMKSYHFQYLVDAYGDIPYFEALQRGENLTPKFDKAEDIYKDLIIQLDNAIALIEGANSVNDVLVPANDDVIFNGNMTNWIKFANTLKMRILIRQSGMSSQQTYISNEFNKIQQSGYGFITADVAVQPGYYKEEGKQNPFYADYGWKVDGAANMNHEATCASEYAITYLTNTNDPRIDYIYAKSASGDEHRGVPQGLTVYPSDGSFKPENISLLGSGLLKSDSQKAVIFSLAESYLLQSEAVYRTYLSGSAESLYDLGVKASFAYLGAPGASDYLAQQTVTNTSWASAFNKIEAIITQKWIALNGINGFESWIEYNRTGFPSNLPVSLLATTPDRPVRLYYPASESSANPTNVPAQPNVYTTKIFWAN